MTNNSTDDFRSVLYSVDRSGKRKWLYVDIVKGAWRRRRQLLAYVLILFYLALPFITINGRPLLRIDIPARNYVLAGQIFWPQDFVYALLFVLIGIVGTLLMVSLCGRVFCGWFCPHNVFLEMVFRPIERLFEGPAHRHRLRDQSNDKQLWRKCAKYVVYALIAGALANAATAIFVGTESFIAGLILNPFAHPYAAVFFILFYFINFFNFVWFREQTCTLVCPYGRLQTAMLDRETLVVAYDKQRGEPRGKKGQGLGDCVDCERCIQVCPTGIDIRNGNQLECIHCASCIDACNDVMGRLQRAPDLISYASEAKLAGEKQRILRPRTVLYGCLLTVLCTVAVYLIAQRPDVQMVQLRQRMAPHMVEIDGKQWMQTALLFSFVNKTDREKQIKVDIAVPGAQIVSQFNPLLLQPNKRVEQIYYVRVPLSAFTLDTLETSLSVRYDKIQKQFALMLQRPLSAEGKEL